MPHSRDSRFVRLTLLIFFTLALVYAGYEARGLFYGPVIHLETRTFATNEAFTSITGRAERITELRLNGTTINVTENGDFNEPFLLAPGSNRLILEASDARGRTTTETMDIVYRAPAELEPTHSTTSDVTAISSASSSTSTSASSTKKAR